MAIPCATLALSLGLLILSLKLPHNAQASRPEDGSGQENGQENGAVIGLASNALKCLALDSHHPVQSQGVVHLTWQGQAERARLVLSIAGAEAAHTIIVNGQPAATGIVHPTGQPCTAEAYYYLDISPQVLVQGDNLIEITNDALPGDNWTAANVRLEVFGDVTALPVGTGDEPGQISPADVTVAAITSIVTFENPYDGSDQEAIAQEPEGYDPGTPTPLLVAIHPRSNAMEWGIDTFGDAAESKGWLLVSPQLHGSWTGDPQPDPPGIFAYASLESQYDAVGAVDYMIDNPDFNVALDQIYLAGYSMGGQGGVVTAAKFPHLFAAAFDNKGPTDMVVWYAEQADYYGDPNHSRVLAMRRECHINEVPRAPAANPFCYERRSGIRFASNYLHLPISITHTLSDALVPIHHSQDLRDAINAHDPDRLAAMYVDTDPPCGAPYHCYEPDPVAVLNFLEPFTLNNTPSHINITTDESKSYYWTNLAQTGGDHWSQVEATYYAITSTVTATISDTHPLTVAFNLGSTPLTDTVPQPGMGLPATAYLVHGGGNNALHSYASGYLTTSLTSVGQFALTISAIDVELSADPSMVSGGQTRTASLTTVAQDQLDNAVPDGTPVTFTTTEGTFPNSSSTYATTAMGGQATTTLTLGPTADLAEVTATIKSVTATTSVDAIYPGIDVQVTPSAGAVYSGDSVTYTYQVANTGDVTLIGVNVVDDNGTPGDSSDDITVGTGLTLEVGSVQTFGRSTTLVQATTNTATVTAQDPLGGTIVDTDSATVEIISGHIYLPAIMKSGR